MLKMPEGNGQEHEFASYSPISPRIIRNTPTQEIGLCLFYSFGILFSLVIYGIFQEKIMTVPYGGEYFTVSVFLVFCNRAFAIVLVSLVVGLKGHSFRNQAPLWKYAIVSSSNVGASVCQYEMLKYVTFTVQMVGKSFKLVPVMFWGATISGKCFSLSDIAVAIAISGGTLEFLLTGDLERQTGGIRFGLILLVTYLGLDGLTSTFQEKVFRDNHTSKYNQMLYVNAGAALISMITLIASGQLWPSLAFCVRHPEAIRDMMMLSLSTVAAQWFIYSQVKEFGALVYAMTINVRQVVSILCSCVFYGHPVVREQAFGFLSITLALFYKSYVSLMVEHNEKAPLLPRRRSAGLSAAPGSGASVEGKPEP